MSRNASGTHSLPTGNPVVTGTAISSTVHNATLSDLSTELTDSLSRSGKGGMTAPLRCADGAVSAPAHSYTSETNSGFYRAGASDVRLSIAGTDRYKQTATGATFTGTLTSTGAGSFAGAAMGSAKITAVASGTATTDAATYGQAHGTSVVLTAYNNWSTPEPSFSAVVGEQMVVLHLESATALAGVSGWDLGAVATAAYRPYQTLTFVGAVYDAAPTPLWYPCTVTLTNAGVITVTAYDNGTSFVSMFAVGEGDKVTVNMAYVVTHPA